MQQRIITNSGLFPRFDRRVNRLLRRGWKFLEMTGWSATVHGIEGGRNVMLVAHLVRETPEPRFVRRLLDWLLGR